MIPASERLAATPALVVVLRRGGLSVCPGEGGPTFDLGAPELAVISALSVAEPRPVGEIVAEIAVRTGADPAHLRAFVADLADRGLAAEPGTAEAVGDGTTAIAAGPGGALDPLEPAIVLTPLVLRTTAAGFEHVDHDGRVLLRLDGDELAATAILREASTRTAALERHRVAAGALALDEDRFDDLLARLATAGVLVAFDPEDMGGRENRDARLIYGSYLRMVKASEEAVTAHEVTEAEREAATGTRRVRVVPIDDRGSPVPLGLGMIVAFARAHQGGALEDHYQFVPSWLTRPERLPVRDGEPSIYLFSNYIWSHGHNLSISEALKEASPHSVTIHGGPDTPKYEGDVDAYFAANPHVDIAVHGEGEATTAHLLEVLVGAVGDGPPDLSRLQDVPGLSYRDGDRVVRTAPRDRITDLNDIPSPFLTGLFDVHATAEMSMAIIETNRGCPYGCTFCDWGSATLARIRKFDMERIFAELEWCAQHQVERIFVADANFGIFERDVEIAEKVAALKAEYGYPTLFSTNYAKNSVKHLRRIVQTLAEGGILIQGLLSLQSMDEGTLKTVKRSNIKLEKYEDLAREFRKAELPLFVDLMLGLPGATRTSFQRDLQDCIDREVTAKVYPTELLVNSPMNEPSYREEHRIETSAPLGGLVRTSRTADGSTKRALLVSTATYTREDYDEMLHLRRVFTVCENFGVLRQVSRFVRQETGIEEVQLYERLRADAEARPDRWPTLSFVFRVLPFVGAAPVSWRLFVDEVHRYIVDELGLPDDDALATVLAVQHALLPSRERQFPVSLELPHDYVAWQRQIVDCKDGGTYAWEGLVPRLAELGPGRFTVDDPNEVCTRGMGYEIDENLHGSWEMASAVARAVSHEHQWDE